MQRLTFLFFAFFTFTLCAFSTPVPSNETSLDLIKRVTHTGRGTWYNTGLGNCGFTDSDSSPVVAIGIGRYGDGGNCNQWVHITNKANGKSAYGKTRDSCESCSTEDLDMSPSLFSSIANLDTGVITIEWNFMAKGWSP